MAALVPWLTFALVLLLLAPSPLALWEARTSRRTLRVLLQGRTKAEVQAAGTGWVRWLRAPSLQRPAARMAAGMIPARREQVAGWICQAGLDGRFMATDLFALKLLGALVACTYLLLLAAASHKPALFALMLGMPPIGFLAPDTWLRSKARRRAAAISRQLPSFLATLAVTVDAGLTLVAALTEVGSRQPDPLGLELRQVSERVQIGVPLAQALSEMADRCRVDELTLFVSTLGQHLQRGGSGLPALLQQQAEDAWRARKAAAQEKAQKASMKLFMPMLFMVFPALMIFLLGPSFISLASYFVGGR